MWPLGVGLTSWHYMWRTTPLHRRELPGSGAHDAPPPIPTGTAGDDLQLVEDGVGPLFHRRYQARIAGSRITPDEVMTRVRADVNRFVPRTFARFTKVLGDGGPIEVGDEYVVRMPGPWDGPVRVVDVTPTSFRLATMTTHLEAGQIEFRAAAAGGADRPARGHDE